MSDMSPREHRIRARAHELWEQAGRPEGQDERFWYEAEQQIDDETRVDAEVRQPPPR